MPDTGLPADIDVDVSIDLAVIINALETDPRFAEMILRVMSKHARKTGDALGKWAQRPIPAAAQNQVPGTKRIS